MNLLYNWCSQPGIYFLIFFITAHNLHSLFRVQAKDDMLHFLVGHSKSKILPHISRLYVKDRIKLRIVWWVTILSSAHQISNKRHRPIEIACDYYCRSCLGPIGNFVNEGSLRQDTSRTRVSSKSVQCCQILHVTNVRTETDPQSPPSSWGRIHFVKCSTQNSRMCTHPRKSFGKNIHLYFIKLCSIIFFLL